LFHIFDQSKDPKLWNVGELWEKGTKVQSIGAMGKILKKKGGRLVNNYV